MAFISDLKIDRFRGIKNLELSNLGSFNLLVGDNNSGKTSVLEAIQILASPFDPSTYVKVGRIRNFFPTLDSLVWFFPVASNAQNSPSKQDIHFSATFDNEKLQLDVKCLEKKFIQSDFVGEPNVPYGKEEVILFEGPSDYETRNLELAVALTKDTEIIKKTLEIKEKEPIPVEQVLPLFKTQFITTAEQKVRTNVDCINDSIKSGERPKIIAALKLFDENITGIEILASKARYVPFIHHKTLGLSPVYIFGDGLQRALAIASAIIPNQDGILLVDDLESAIHTKALGRLFAWLVDACNQFNVQLIATTHSLETIDAIIEANENQLSSLVGYRLENLNDATEAKRFSGETLHDLRFEFGQDVR